MNDTINLEEPTNAAQNTWLEGHENTIDSVVEWMKGVNIQRVTCRVTGGGDEGQLEEFSFFRDGVGELDDCEAEGFDEFEDDVEQATFELAYWEISNNDGGQATLEIHSDGRYSVSGGWYGGYTDANTLYASVSDAKWELEDKEPSGSCIVSIDLPVAEAKMLKRMLKRRIKQLPKSSPARVAAARLIARVNKGLRA